MPKYLILLSGAVLLLFVAGLGATMVAFPFAGGEFHGIFAYSDGGRLASALIAYRVHTGTLALCAGLLILVGYPLPWRVIALAAMVVGCRYWWGIITFPHASASFRYNATALLATIPVVTYAACAGAHRLRAWSLARITAGGARGSKEGS